MQPDFEQGGYLVHSDDGPKVVPLQRATKEEPCVIDYATFTFAEKAIHRLNPKLKPFTDLEIVESVADYMLDAILGKTADLLPGGGMNGYRASVKAGQYMMIAGGANNDTIMVTIYGFAFASCDPGMPKRLTAEGSSDTSCIAWGKITQTGGSSAMGTAGGGGSQTPADSPVKNGGMAPDTPDCPADHVWSETQKICVKAAGTGTAATPTEASTPGAPGGTSCPRGMTPVGDSCISSSEQPAGVPCPEGTTLNAANKCETLGSTTGDSSRSGNCGAPEQPKCSTSDKPLLDAIWDIFKTPTEADQNFISNTGKSQIGLLDRVLGNEFNPYHGWELSFPSTFPTAADCSPWTFSVAGKQQVIDPCPTAYKIRSIAEFCLYVITLFSLFRILFGPRAISRG